MVCRFMGYMVTYSDASRLFTETIFLLKTEIL